MVFTLIQAASKKWLRLKGRKQLPKVIEGIKFTDGAYSGASGHSFRQHPATDSGVSGHL